ncbi:hypothetical protein EVAR_97854_1 [Eumeta japonica]|uniref:Uncharacterized protein n=1 Tax=Eumeta variegata TaxID=151549 RepID=A0A4C1WVU8_EUMVA|nr:hypothetical protein EVAR_97854_1 [Eumeta japonica]
MKDVGLLMENSQGGDGEESASPKLSLTGRNATAKSATTRLYSSECGILTIEPAYFRAAASCPQHRFATFFVIDQEVRVLIPLDWTSGSWTAKCPYHQALKIGTECLTG